LALFVNGEKKLPGRGNGNRIEKRSIAHLLRREAFHGGKRKGWYRHQDEGCCSEDFRKHAQTYTHRRHLSKTQKPAACKGARDLSL
jgi:hypothetical protein